MEDMTILQKILYAFSSAFRSIFSFFKCKVLKKEEYEPYEMDDLDNEDVFYRKLMNIVFSVYGFLGGYITTTFIGYELARFQSFASASNLISENYSGSPLTIIVCGVLLLGGWLGFLAIDMLLFAFFRIAIASKLSDDEDFAKSEILTGVAYSILIAVFVALITLVIPGNLIIRLL